MFQFQLVPWKSDKQKSVVVFLVFSFPCHNSAAVQGYFGAMRKAVEDKKNRGSKARQAEKKWYNKRGREIQKERERERERAPPAKSYWAVCRHTKATVSWHHNRKWCLAGASILLASVHTCTHTHTQTAISSRAWGTKQILPVRARIHFNSSLLVIRQ